MRVIVPACTPPLSLTPSLYIPCSNQWVLDMEMAWLLLMGCCWQTAAMRQRATIKYGADMNPPLSTPRVVRLFTWIYNILLYVRL